MTAEELMDACNKWSAEHNKEARELLARPEMNEVFAGMAHGILAHHGAEGLVSVIGRILLDAVICSFMLGYTLRSTETSTPTDIPVDFKRAFGES